MANVTSTAANGKLPPTSIGVSKELHEATAKSVSRAKDAFAQMRTAAESATGMFEEPLRTARAHGVAMTLKAIDVAQANTAASFDFLKAYIGAKTIGEAMNLQTVYARKQFELITGHLKDARDATEKAAADVGRSSRAAGHKAAHPSRPPGRS